MRTSNPLFNFAESRRKCHPMSWSDILPWAAALISLLLVSGGKSTRLSIDNWRVRTAYLAFGTPILCSPIISLWISQLWGLEQSPDGIVTFAWIGIGASLPLSLLCARGFGFGTYATYLAYLERSGNITMRSLWAIWAVTTAALASLGIALLLTN
jgi:hypothetical protein